MNLFKCDAPDLADAGRLSRRAFVRVALRGQVCGRNEDTAIGVAHAQANPEQAPVAVGDARVFIAVFDFLEQRRAPVDIAFRCPARMRVVDTAMTAQFLKADPDIGLDVFHQMPDMDVSIGIGQGSGDENLSGHASDQQT